MLDQIVKEAMEKSCREVIWDMEEMGFSSSSYSDRLEFFCKVFPKAERNLRTRYEADSFSFLSNFPEALKVILEFYINDYDLIRIKIDKREYEVMFKEEIKEYKDFTFDPNKCSMTDEWLFHGDYDLIALKAFQDFNPWSCKYLVSRTPLEFYNLRNIPSSIIVRTPVCLENCVCRTTVLVDKEDPHIHINGDCIITGKQDRASVEVFSDSVIIVGKGNLTIKKQDKQPCIGVSTHTGMSYGRWSPNSVREFGIILSNDVTVRCVTDDKFALGNYGYDYVPIISIEEGCELIAPEMEGTRVIKTNAHAPEGSTKISNPVIYEVLKKGQTFLDLYDKDDMEMIKELESYGVKIPTNRFIESRRLKASLRIKRIHRDADVSMLFNGEENYSRAQAVTILLNPDLYASEEITYESRKMSYFAEKYGYVEKAVSVTNGLIKFGYEKLVSSKYSEEVRDYLIQVLYEMIPAYYYDGTWHNDNLKTVKEHLDNCDKITTEVNYNKFFEDYGF